MIYLALKVHDHDGVATIANDKVFVVFGKAVYVVYGDIGNSQGFEGVDGFGCFYAPHLYCTVRRRTEINRGFIKNIKTSQ